MNFLAHCALAQDAKTVWQLDTQQYQGLLAGAVVGDFVKGSISEDLPTALRAGIRLHRKIDALSNISHHTKQCCRRFPTSQRRFAPIYVDLVADYHLAHTWSNYYASNLDEFAQECYAAISLHEHHLSTSGLRFFTYMREENLLTKYHDWEAIQRGLHSVLRRLDRMHMFAEVTTSTQAVLQDCAEDCDALYRELQEAWQSWNAFQV